MAAVETAQENAKATIYKAEETIRELERAVRSFPKMRDDRTKIAMTKAEETIRELQEVVQPNLESARAGLSPWLLGAALGSIAFAVTLYARKQKDDAVFVGLWAPTFLALGLFKDILTLRRKRT